MGRKKIYASKEEQVEARKQRERDRYANDPEYRAKIRERIDRCRLGKYSSEDARKERNEKRRQKYQETNEKEYARNRLGCKSKEEWMAENARLRELDPENELQARNQYEGKRREVVRRFHAGEITEEQCDAELDALRDAKNAYMREWYKTEAGRKYVRGNQLRKYGLTIEQFDVMYEAQKGCCAICKTPRPPFGVTGMAVDHCHKTGKVRALLCVQCNIAVGCVREDISIATSMIEYLKMVQAEE